MHLTYKIYCFRMNCSVALNTFTAGLYIIHIFHFFSGTYRTIPLVPPVVVQAAWSSQQEHVNVFTVLCSYGLCVVLEHAPHLLKKIHIPIKQSLLIFSLLQPLATTNLQYVFMNLSLLNIYTEGITQYKTFGVIWYNVLEIHPILHFFLWLKNMLYACSICLSANVFIGSCVVSTLWFHQ